MEDDRESDDRAGESEPVERTDVQERHGWQPMRQVLHSQKRNLSWNPSMWANDYSRGADREG